MDALNQAIAQISDVLWNSVLLFLLVGTGVYFSVRTRFVQVRKFKSYPRQQPLLMQALL